MNDSLLRAFLRGGVFVAGVSVVLMLATPPNSAEFVVSTCSLLIGLTLTGLVALVARLGRS